MDYSELRKNLDLKDWETLEQTANTIISQSSRDLILWNEVLKEIAKQKELIGKPNN